MAIECGVAIIEPGVCGYGLCMTPPLLNMAVAGPAGIVGDTRAPTWPAWCGGGCLALRRADWPQHRRYPIDLHREAAHVLAPAARAGALLGTLGAPARTSITSAISVSRALRSRGSCAAKTPSHDSMVPGSRPHALVPRFPHTAYHCSLPIAAVATCAVACCVRGRVRAPSTSPGARFLVAYYTPGPPERHRRPASLVAPKDPRRAGPGRAP